MPIPPLAKLGPAIDATLHPLNPVQRRALGGVLGELGQVLREGQGDLLLKELAAALFGFADTAPAHEVVPGAFRTKATWFAKQLSGGLTPEAARQIGTSFEEIGRLLEVDSYPYPNWSAPDSNTVGSRVVGALQAMNPDERGAVSAALSGVGHILAAGAAGDAVCQDVGARVGEIAAHLGERLPPMLSGALIGVAHRLRDTHLQQVQWDTVQFFIQVGQLVAQSS